MKQSGHVPVAAPDFGCNPRMSHPTSARFAAAPARILPERAPPPIAGAEARRRRIVFLARDLDTLRACCGSLIATLKSRGDAILCLADAAHSDYAMALRQMGIEVETLAKCGTGLALRAPRLDVRALRVRLAEWRADVAVCVGLSASAAGALAAREAKVGRVVTLLKEGAEFGSGVGVGLRARLGGSRHQLRDALQSCHAAVIYGRTAAAQHGHPGLPTAHLELCSVPGAGVDLTEYAETALPPIGQGIVFLMLAPLRNCRGVLDFAKAARLLRGRGAHARFVLAGEEDRGAGGVPVAELRAFKDSLDYVGAPVDTAALLRACHVFVQPAYAEPTGSEVLEAMATGRPVIATIGHRWQEAVDERVNGILIPAQDATALAEAMQSLLRRPDLIPAMARASRLKAERRYDQAMIDRSIVAVLDA